jgi:Transposase DDE domain group 1
VLISGRRRRLGGTRRLTILLILGIFPGFLQQNRPIRSNDVYLTHEITMHEGGGLMETQCTQRSFGFQQNGSRKIVARFDGGRVSSDGGGILLREVDERFGFVAKFAGCFTDYRDPEKIEHSLVDLLKQRLFGLCLGYEDLVDHDWLRHDALLAAIVGKADPEGNDRPSRRDRGKALAGKSTLNRLELTPVGADAGDRYKKVTADVHQIHNFFVDAFLLQHAVPPERIVLDLDATDDPVHGQQLGRFFHGYYKNYCFLPLYIFCQDHPLLALLRPSDIDACAGAQKHLARIVARIRQVWPRVKIVIRGDSGFCRENLMNWCEENDVDFVFGLAKNRRLIKILGKELHEAHQLFEQTGQASRVFKDFTYCTQKSWSRERRVIGKAEHLEKGANPRFVVTSLPADQYDAATVYEDEYCARGNMENRIKEQQLFLFADRTSCQTLRANQLRLAFSTVAYVLLRALREHGLKGTPLESAQADTIRLRLLKIGAVVRITVRKVWIALSEAFPWQPLFEQVYDQLTAWRSTVPIHNST